MTNTPTPIAGTMRPEGYAQDATLTLTEVAELLERDLSTIRTWRKKDR